MPFDEELAAIVGRCLEKDRERRYATAGAFADALDLWLQGGSSEADPVLKHTLAIAEAYADRGLARRRAGDREGAATDLRLALEVAPAEWSRRASILSSLREITS